MEMTIIDEPHDIQKEVYNKNTQRRKLMYPPREAYLFIPNNFQIIEENIEKPQKSLRRIFEGKFEFNTYENTKIKELYEEIQKRNAKEKKDPNKRLDISEMARYDVLRMLQATCFKVDDTIKLLTLHLQWRREKLPNFVIKPKILEILEKGFLYVHGRDCNYRPILVVNAGVYMRIRGNYRFEEWENFIIFFMNYLINNLIIPGQIENWSIITDVRGVSMLSIPSDFKKLMNVLSSNYRCRLFVNYIFGMSTLLNFIWKLLQAFLDETARKKIRFINNSNQNEVFTYIHPSQVEKKYGGLAENKASEFFPGFMPSSTFLLDTQDKNQVLISEEKYKELSENGKLAAVNKEIIDSYDNDRRKIVNALPQKMKEEILHKSSNDFRLLQSTCVENTNIYQNNLYNQENNFTFKENEMKTNNNINAGAPLGATLDLKSQEYEHGLKYNNSFNLLTNNPTINYREIDIPVKQQDVPMSEKNEEIFKIISDVRSEFENGKFIKLYFFYNVLFHMIIKF